MHFITDRCYTRGSCGNIWSYSVQQESQDRSGFFSGKAEIPFCSQYDQPCLVVHCGRLLYQEQLHCADAFSVVGLCHYEPRAGCCATASARLRHPCNVPAKCLQTLCKEPAKHLQRAYRQHLQSAYKKTPCKPLSSCAPFFECSVGRRRGWRTS